MAPSPSFFSSFPKALDSFREVLNGVEAPLAAAVSPVSKQLYVGAAASDFPSLGGFVRVGSELVSYSSIDGFALSGVSRGLSGTSATIHREGELVKLVIAAEHHNSLAAAVLELERKAGLVGEFPDASSRVLGSRAEHLRLAWETPRALWRATVESGPAPLTTQFVDLSRGFPIRRRWDFGAAGSSSEQNPIVTFAEPGFYDVSLAVYCQNGTMARTLKRNSIRVYPGGVLSDPALAVFVVDKLTGELRPGFRGRAPLIVQIVDQTRGDIIRRTFSFGDGESEVLEGAWNHRVVHTYSEPGTYRPAVHVEGTENAELGKEIRLAESPRQIEVIGSGDSLYDTDVDDVSLMPFSTDCDPGLRPIDTGVSDENELRQEWCHDRRSTENDRQNCDDGAST